MADDVDRNLAILDRLRKELLEERQYECRMKGVHKDPYLMQTINGVNYMFCEYCQGTYSIAYAEMKGPEAY